MLDERVVNMPRPEEHSDARLSVQALTTEDGHAIRFEIHSYAPTGGSSRFREDNDVVLVFTSGPLMLGQVTAHESKAAVKRPEHICVVPGPIEGRAVVKAGAAEVLQIRIPHAILADVAHSLGQYYHPALVEAAFCKVDHTLADLAGSLIDYLQRNSEPNAIKLETYARAFAGFVISRYLNRPDAPARAEGGLSKRALRRVTTMLEARFEEELTLAQLAEVAELSTSHFCREFKRTTGKSPFQYLLNLRCGHAMKRLEGSEDSVLAIALECGFGSAQAFSRAFRRVVGCSPSEYRRLNRV